MITEIQTYCPKPTQIGAHLRVVAPLAWLRREHPEAFRVEHVEDKQSSLHKMMTADICIMQRPFSDLCVQRAKMAKLAGCKLWIDWDDDLTTVHPANKVWQYYQFDHLEENLATLQSLADVVTVSTKTLIPVFGKHAPDVRLVPNAVEDRLIPTELPKSTRKCIMWRGSDSHMIDLATFRNVLIEFAKEFSPEWKFCFIGKNPEAIIHGMPEGSWKNIPEMQYYDLMETLQKFAAPIHIVPLADNDFNRAKSNLAYLEGACAGSVVLAPDWEEWECPGVAPYWNDHVFLEELKAMARNLEGCKEAAAKGLAYVREHHALSVVNETRWDIIQDLTS